ncbi:unnamed protein product (macronuclear) [Paramecium tetraurelia]|uniref:Uncharacterized protein n=1 Tax=Paramecium tetraurelia TaxID=5888 RepID=A0CHZ6_PARTE|nr:uncharacterized protein GSPATT00038515001 [Paramecium tetraurelia]CAK70413.1 unnamed protein product [Paramecium tetraurelia]|eukprot:XP_001437810.1 hypothetical protein (macronuclear) [Paramecium tetraurelia strain d4-2]
MNYPFNPSPSYSFSVAKKIQSHFLLPQISMGPGQYHLKTEKKGGTLNFGSYSQRKMILAQDALTPGPLHYTINTYRSQGVSFANSIKPINKPSLSPGPGQYLPMDEPHSRLGGSISRTSRKETFDNQIPGAGQYPIKSTLNTLGFKFKQLHKRARTDQMSPGPGSYSISQDSLNHGVKMHNSTRTWSYILKTETPGPGTYQKESFIQNRSSSKHSKVSSKEQSKILKKCFSQHEPKQSNRIGKISSSKGNIDSHGNLTTRSKFKSNHLSQQQNISDSYNRMREYGKLKVTFTKQVRKEEFLDEFSTPIARKVSRSPGPAMYADTKFKPNSKLGFMPTSRKGETFKPKEGPGVGEYSKIIPFGKIYSKHITPKRQFFKFKDLNQYDFDQ